MRGRTGEYLRHALDQTSLPDGWDPRIHGREELPLVQSGPDQNRHIGDSSPLHGLQRRLRNHLPIDNREKDHQLRETGELAVGVSLRFEQARGRNARQRLRSPRRIAQLPEEHLGDLVGPVLGDQVLRGAALADRAVEELAGARRTEKCADAHGACRLTEDRHLAGIAPEAVDVVAHPLESGDLIAQAGIAGATELLAADPAQMHVAQRAQTVVDRDHHDVAAARQVLPFVDGSGTRPDQKASAMDPHQDRTPRIVETGRPDIEGEAVLGLPGAAGVQEAEQR